MEQRTRLWINRRLVGGRLPTTLCQSLTEFLTLRADPHVRSLHADPARNAINLPKTHIVIVQRDPQVAKLEIRPLALENLNLVQHFTQIRKV